MKESIELNTYIEYAGIGVIILIISLNFAVMIRLSMGKIIVKCK